MHLPADIGEFPGHQWERAFGYLDSPLFQVTTQTSTLRGSTPPTWAPCSEALKMLSCQTGTAIVCVFVC